MLPANYRAGSASATSAHARGKGCDRPHDGDESGDDDRLSAIALEVRVGPVQVLLPDQAGKPALQADAGHAADLSSSLHCQGWRRP